MVEHPLPKYSGGRGRRIMHGGPGKSESPYLKNELKAKRAGVMTQVVRVLEALRSIPSTGQKKFFFLTV
jgi:hypothetical protein